MGGSLAVHFERGRCRLPIPTRAERTCSTVCTRTEPSARVVARSTVWTLETTGIDEGLVGEVKTRRNLKPWPSGAGFQGEGDLFAGVK